MPAAPATYALAPDFGITHTAFSGAVTGQTLVGALRALHDDPRWRFGLDLLWDCRAVTGLALAPDELAALIEMGTEDTEGRDVSIVRRDLDEAIAVLFRHVAGRRGKEAHVCYGIDDALAVLGLDGEAWAALQADRVAVEADAV